LVFVQHSTFKSGIKSQYFDTALLSTVRGKGRENGGRVEQTVKSILIKVRAQIFNSFWLNYVGFYCLDGGWKPILCSKWSDLIVVTCNCGQGQNI